MISPGTTHDLPSCMLPGHGTVANCKSTPAGYFTVTDLLRAQRIGAAAFTIQSTSIVAPLSILVLLSRLPYLSATMVFRSGFEVQLVSADTKIPFKEHEKDGKIYVEAEPDAEYFIAIRRVDMSGSPVIKSYYYIDGNFLGYYSFHKSVQKEPSYQGVFSRTNGVAKTSSLKFSKPKAASDGDGYRGGMGKAEIKLYEAISSGMTTARDFAPDFEYALAGAANAGDGKKKFLLSTKGSTVLKTETVTQPGSIVRYESFVTGKCIGSILLN